MKDFQTPESKLEYVKKFMYDNLDFREVYKAIDRGVFEDADDFVDYIEDVRAPENDS